MELFTRRENLKTSYHPYSAYIVDRPSLPPLWQAAKDRESAPHAPYRHSAVFKFSPWRRHANCSAIRIVCHKVCSDPVWHLTPSVPEPKRTGSHHRPIQRETKKKAWRFYFNMLASPKANRKPTVMIPITTPIPTAPSFIAFVACMSASSSSMG